MALFRRYTLIVENDSGSLFPLDMLRMDSCLPARSDDVKQLVETRRKLKGGPGYDVKGLRRRVVLNRFAPEGVPARRDAWEKAGWIVVRDDADPQPEESDQGPGKPTQKVR